MASDSKIKLSYFPIIGLAEPIRFLLAYLGKEFEDHRIGGKEWLATKSTTPWGKVPVLEINGQRVTQNVAICRYLAKEAGLCGKDNWENLRIDEIVDVLGDFRTELAKYHYELDAKKKESLKDPLFNEIVPFYMKKLEALIKENNGYLANGKLSWADLYFGAVSDYLNYMFGSEITDGYPSFKALKEKVYALPQIKAWLDKRPAEDYSYRDEILAALSKK
ncbi:glutathione S-transferase-like [Homalodisca vitripennis]|uniref:glutathione transferase n=1 Tax=Homalodisca liturata TaxID=320908 RepID=A0A1B6JL75_9HEMI|nr:glutathione S-transferase-like [Homalodisca vitripennis]